MIQAEELAGKLRLDPLPVVLGLNLKIGPEQVDDGEVSRGLVIRHRAAFEDEPAGHAMRMGKFPEEAGLAYASLPDNCYHLAVTGQGLLPGLAEGLNLGLAANERGEPTGCGSL